jgi:hypothetical protein
MEYFEVSGDIIIAMTIGGTMPNSLISNFAIFARNGSSSKRRMTTEVWPPLRGVVWATFGILEIGWEILRQRLTWNASCVEHWETEKASRLGSINCACPNYSND